MKQSILTLLVVALASVSCATIAQNTTTDWEATLENCEIKLPIKGSSKSDAQDQKIAEKYHKVELIWLHFEKSMKKATSLQPRRVYLVSETLKNGSQVEYLIPVEDYDAGINAPIFPEWKSKKNRFYLAACFDKHYTP
jgi:hypothetical protein